MHINQGLQDLVHEALGLLWRQGAALLPHELLEVVLEVLKNKIELIIFKYGFFQPTNTEKFISGVSF